MHKKIIAKVAELNDNGTYTGVVVVQKKILGFIKYSKKYYLLKNAANANKYFFDKKLEWSDFGAWGSFVSEPFEFENEKDCIDAINDELLYFGL